jgi:O-methyltransferase
LAIVNGAALSGPLEIASRYSKSTPHRLASMQAACELIEIEGVEGDVVECGVWKGGNIMLARMICPERICWLFDTFAGMTEPGPHDKKKSGRMAAEIMALKPDKRMSYASIEEVRDGFHREGLLDLTRLRFVQGDVCDTLKVPENIPERIALLRLDTDWYESTKASLEVLYPRLEIGGIMIVDDYGHWMGARKAVQEYFVRNGWSSTKFQEVDYSAVMMVKDK